MRLRLRWRTIASTDRRDQAKIRAPVLSGSRKHSLSSTMDTRSRPTRAGKLATSENSKFELKQFIFTRQRTCDRRQARGDGGAFRPRQEAATLRCLASDAGWRSNKVFSAIMGRAANERRKRREGASRRDALCRRTVIFSLRGLLTTPPCSEVVNWYVFSTPIAVAASDIETFKGFSDERPPCSRCAGYAVTIARRCRRARSDRGERINGHSASVLCQRNCSRVA